jgi:hypothetical protein
VRSGADDPLAAHARARHNGYRGRKRDARAGAVELVIPKLRDCSCFPGCLLERQRRARAQPVNAHDTPCLVLASGARHIKGRPVSASYCTRSDRTTPLRSRQRRRAAAPTTDRAAPAPILIHRTSTGPVSLDPGELNRGPPMRFSIPPSEAPKSRALEQTCSNPDSILGDKAVTRTAVAFAADD